MTLLSALRQELKTTRKLEISIGLQIETNVCPSMVPVSCTWRNTQNQEN
jgi:hypothetical protein